MKETFPESQPEKVTIEPNLEKEASKESIETLKLLREFVDKGYVLHGSKRTSEMLEPRQADDTNKERVIGRQNAIYATDKIEVPLFMALKDFKDPENRSMRSGYSGTAGADGITWHMYGENTALTPGYVYVLPKDTFDLMSDSNGDEELISREPVMPVAVFKIEPDILNLFPNITLDLK
jgi:hypothetical protein